MNNPNENTKIPLHEKAIWVLGVLMGALALANLLGLTKFDLWSFEAILLLLVFLLAYIPRFVKNKEKPLRLIIDVVFFLCGVIPAVYLLFNVERLEWYYGTLWTTGDIICGTMLILAILKLVYDKYGIAMPIIACIFLAYVLFGHYLPKNMMWHRKIPFQQMVSYMFSPVALFGTVFSTFCRIIILYMLFGAFLDVSGVGSCMTSLAFALAGKYRGGPAKVAVLSSALLGSINGNSVANVVTTGSITIPLMKKVGYRSHFAGAVEAVASTGGQILPPVMGAGAFIMAEFLQISFNQVALAALIPALLYYLAIFLMVDLEAVKTGLKGLSEEELPDRKKVLKESYMLLPIVILVVMLLVVGASITRSGIIAILSCIIVSLFNKEHRMTPKKICRALVNGCKDCIGIAGVCSLAGLVIGAVSMTGLGTRFSSMILQIANNNLTILAIFTALICIVLGMGLPTTAAYIICVTVAAPALTKVGIPLLSVHMFVFYYAILAAITPPVAAASYAAASIADAPIMKTGWQAVKLGLTAYIIPFFFLFNPSLLMQGGFSAIIQSSLTSVLAVIVLAIALENSFFFLKWKLNPVSRILLLTACITLMDPSTMTDLIGLGITIIAFFLSYIFGRRKVYAEE